MGADATRVRAAKEHAITGILHSPTPFAGFEAFRRFTEIVAQNVPSTFTEREQKIVTARVNGSTVQDSSTSNLIFKIPDLIQFILGAITLEPGDVIATGTPAGVGVFRQPPSFIKVGEIVEVDLEGLGNLMNPICD